MNYYSIQWSLDTKIMGFLPQIKKTITNCHIDTEPRFIRHHGFKKIDFEPILSFPVIDEKSNLTDLIQVASIGFNATLVISDKLKKVLKGHGKDGFQYFPLEVFHKGISYTDYWLLHPTKVSMEMVDFEKSEVWMMEHTFNQVEQLSIKTVEEYNTEKRRIENMGYPYSIRLTELTLKGGGDFFVISNIEGGYKFFVSEKLKQEIEAANCTGIEFMPYKLTFNEWTTPNGLREKIYGKV